MNEIEDIEIEQEPRDGAMILRPKGEIDLSRAPALRVHLGQALSAKPVRLIIDLQDVPYMDSSGVATFVEAMQLSRKYGSKLILCGLRDRVRSVFEIARLDMVFTLVTDTDEAMAS